MLRDSIRELSIRYSFKPQFGEEMPEYFEALDDGIQSINAQIRMKEALKDFKIKHGSEDLITAGEAADLIESLMIGRV